MENQASWIVYQPLIVGLGAVVVATIGNTLLEWFRHTIRQRREAQTVRVAVAEELRVHREMYKNSISQDQRNEDSGHFLIPIDRFMPVYDALIGKLGLLRPQEAKVVLRAYSNIILIPKNLRIMGRVHSDNFASFVEVPVIYKHVLINMNERLVEVIDEALAALDR